MKSNGLSTFRWEACHDPNRNNWCKSWGYGSNNPQHKGVCVPGYSSGQWSNTGISVWRNREIPCGSVGTNRRGPHTMWSASFWRYSDCQEVYSAYTVYHLCAYETYFATLVAKEVNSICLNSHLINIRMKSNEWFWDLWRLKDVLNMRFSKEAL